MLRRARPLTLIEVVGKEPPVRSKHPEL